MEHKHFPDNKDLTPLQLIKKVSSSYKKYRIKSLKSTADKDTLDYLIILAEITYPAYCNHWKEDDAKIEWVSPEEKFSINYNLHTPTGPTNIRLRGMRDALIRINGDSGIFETKTKSRINEEEIRDGLKSDMQTMIYLFATYLETGELPKKVLYNVIRRSTMYRRKEESIISYAKRLEEDIDKRPDFYFMRWEVDITKTDVINFKSKTLDPLLIQFVDWYNSVKKNINDRFQSPCHFQNSNALFGKYGRSDMWAAMQGNTRPYSIRKVPFPELQESFEDS